MKGTSVLDASAVLAFLQGEPGQGAVLHALQTQRCVVSAANEAEIIRIPEKPRPSGWGDIGRTHGVRTVGFCAGPR